MFQLLEERGERAFFGKFILCINWLKTGIISQTLMVFDKIRLYYRLILYVFGQQTKVMEASHANLMLLALLEIVRNGTRNGTTLKSNFGTRNGTPFRFFKGTDSGTGTADFSERVILCT